MLQQFPRHNLDAAKITWGSAAIEATVSIFNLRNARDESVLSHLKRALVWIISTLAIVSAVTRGVVMAVC
jgi:hypothetical protein